MNIGIHAVRTMTENLSPKLNRRINGGSLKHVLIIGERGIIWEHDTRNTWAHIEGVLSEQADLDGFSRAEAWTK